MNGRKHDGRFRIRALPHRKGKRGKTCIQLDRALDTGRYLCKHSELLIGADFGKTAQAAFNEAVIAELFSNGFDCFHWTHHQQSAKQITAF